MAKRKPTEAQKRLAALEATPALPLKLDIGCGKNKQAGFHGVDAIQFDGVDTVMDMRQPWPWADSSVEDVHCSHFLEHLTGAERIHFFNELYRVLKPGKQARIITPHWSHERAYGDPTHQWPPVCGWTYFYLGKGWRDVNAPHVGYVCDFEWVLAGAHDPNDEWVAFRTPEVKQIYMSRNINTTTDLIATITAKKA